MRSKIHGKFNRYIRCPYCGIKETYIHDFITHRIDYHERPLIETLEQLVYELNVDCKCCCNCRCCCKCCDD